MQEKCDCGASAIGSPGHSEWCSTLKNPLDLDELAIDLEKLWQDDMYAHGLIPMEDDDETN